MQEKVRVTNKNIDWDHFRELVKAKINPRISLKTPNELDLVVTIVLPVLFESAEAPTPANARENTSTTEYPQMIVHAVRKGRVT